MAGGYIVIYSTIAHETKSQLNLSLIRSIKANSYHSIIPVIMHISKKAGNVLGLSLFFLLAAGVYVSADSTKPSQLERIRKQLQILEKSPSNLRTGQRRAIQNIRNIIEDHKIEPEYTPPNDIDEDFEGDVGEEEFPPEVIVLLMIAIPLTIVLVGIRYGPLPVRLAIAIIMDSIVAIYILFFSGAF